MVSFSTAGFALTAGERAWRNCQTQGRVSWAEAEMQRVFELAPAAIVTFRGPDFVVELANAAMVVLRGRPPVEVIGRPVFEALPDAAGQGLAEIFTALHRTGQA